MKKNILFIILLYCVNGAVQAQLCDSHTGSCYQKDACYEEAQLSTQTYNYATVHNIYKATGVSVDLFMTIWSPCTLPDNIDSTTTAHNCRGCKRPFILLIHGGGFRIGCRTGLTDECEEFAKRGYVVASIDYRLGWVQGDEKAICKNFCSSGPCTILQEDSCKSVYRDSMDFAVYRALQDASAAMRFIVHYADNLNVDKNYLYVGGQSAGGVIATDLCYLNQQELNLRMPAAYPILGPYKAYGNSFTDEYKISGLFNNWGCVADTGFINGVEDKIPMIAFHGIDDTIVPFSKGSPLGCKKATYGNACGSKLICKKLAETYPGLPIETYFCYGGHGIFNGQLSTDLKALYRVEKAVCFFNRLRSGDKTQTFIRINKPDSEITYQELDSISPLTCNYTASAMNGTFKTYTNEALRVNMGNRFTIYPNPTASQATLQVKAGQKKINITITDFEGKILWSRQNITERAISLPIGKFASGLYFVIIKAEEYSEITRLIKTN